MKVQVFPGFVQCQCSPWVPPRLELPVPHKISRDRSFFCSPFGPRGHLWRGSHKTREGEWYQYFFGSFFPSVSCESEVSKGFVTKSNPPVSFFLQGTFWVSIKKTLMRRRQGGGVSLPLLPSPIPFSGSPSFWSWILNHPIFFWPFAATLKKSLYLPEM